MTKIDPKYFDYAASVPPFEEVLDVFKQYSIDHFANPSSIHPAGLSAKNTLGELKRKFCQQLNFNDGRLFLCASASEANNTILESYHDQKILLVEDVHSSIWYAKDKYPKNVSVFTINPDGSIDIDRLLVELDKSPALMAMTHASNETWRIHDIETICRFAKARGVKTLVDAAQTIGHISIDMETIEVDYLVFSAHKFGGCRGTGGILARDLSFDALIKGGEQEWQKRAGTENIAGLAAAEKALEISLSSSAEEAQRLSALNKTFCDTIKESIPGVLFNSEISTDSLASLISLSIAGKSGTEIVRALSLDDISISTGSACHSDQEEPSRVIMALGRSQDEASGTIRISMGRGTNEDAILELAKQLSS